MSYLNAFPLIQNTDWDFEEPPRDNFGGASMPSAEVAMKKQKLLSVCYQSQKAE